MKNPIMKNAANDSFEVYNEILSSLELGEMNQDDALNLDHLKWTAEQGNIAGLLKLRDFSVDHPYVVEVASAAASKGQLEFLTEMDTMGLLGESCYPAIHVAASKCQTECLKFLVSRLGTKYLGYEDENGLWPIHLAARCPITDTLRAVLRLYPHYKPRISWFSQSKTKIISPLLEPVRNGLLENARILLERFPELTNYKDGKNNTVIHLSMDFVDDLMLKLVLPCSSPEIIAARNVDGDTALYLGLSHKNCLDKHALLMSTGHLTGIERNNKGQTPVFIYRRTRDLKAPAIRSKLKQIFNLKSEEELNEALQIVMNTENDEGHVVELRKSCFFF